MDFLCDTLAFARTFRIFTIVDEHTRECLATEADTSLPGLRSGVRLRLFLSPIAFTSS